jgi:uncharacterized protein (TIGR03086 family)
VLAAVRPDHFGAPTPCASWDVRALINHFIGTARWAAATIGGNDVVARDHTVGDCLIAYDDSVRDAIAAFESPGTLEQTFTLPFGELSGPALMGMIAGDLFTHGWDLARAIGHHTDLDPELADELLIQAKAGVTDAMRGPDGVSSFGPIVDAPADSSPADRLAAFLGRSK